ncbi:hypothetical protein [Pseudanabaena sp. PCC 6802]|uniref:hypothetical protein n=1 Tax=Pseudanabaena sp. PCC 6802 TaxID=118173 RepID=UPI00034B851F|nr:hypothetical protein [Pseudanabaena sp. PCC 6802]
MSVFEQQLGRKDLPAATQTLQQLLKVNPNDPQVQIATADLYKIEGKSDRAEAIYRDVLKSCSQTKLLAQARKGLQEIEDADLKEHKDGIAQAIAAVGGQNLGFLSIHPVPSDRKQEAATKLAKIFRIDPYTAKTQIPSRNLKVLRIGRLGEMQFYGQKLIEAGIPALWTSLSAISSINVHTVAYFEPAPDKSGIYAVCNPEPGKDSTAHPIKFNWSDVSQRVYGLLPTYGEVVTVDAKHQLARKEEILDLVRICDLHLPAQNCILRFHDNCYQFAEGIQFEVKRSFEHIAPTVEERWQSLSAWLSTSMPQVEGKDDFNDFAEMFLAYPDFLKEIDPKIDLFRVKESLWDNCFQIYSGTIFKCNL